jgi:hypothetical protein
MGNGVVANEGCYHDQEHINESCPTKVPADLVPAAARAPACNRCKAARGPGLGAWPAIVPGGASMAGLHRLIRLRPGPAVMDSCMATGPG